MSEIIDIEASIESLSKVILRVAEQHQRLRRQLKITADELERVNGKSNFVQAAHDLIAQIEEENHV